MSSRDDRGRPQDLTASVRIATFNLENLDDGPEVEPDLTTRATLMRPQLERLRADVLCLQEVHAQGESGDRELRALDRLLDGTPYAGYERAVTRTEEGEPYAERNLVVLTRFAIAREQQLNGDLVTPPSYAPVTADPPQEAEPVRWERPLLHVTLELPGGRPLELIDLHLKSKRPVEIAGALLDPFTWRSSSSRAEGSFLSAMQRFAQAVETRMLVDQLFDADADALVAVVGDLNADVGDVEVRALRGGVEETGNPALAARVLVPLTRSVAASRRYSLIYQGAGELIDQILVSRGLLAAYGTTEIHNELLHDESIAFATDVLYPESDHAPVVSDFPGID